MTAITPYAELADVLDNLPLLVRERRRQQRLSLRDAADQSGVSFNTICRIEKGSDTAMSIVIAALRWLDKPAEATR